MTCEHGFIGACAVCDGCGQSPEKVCAPNGTIESGPGGTTFAGPGAVDIFRAVALSSALRLYAKCGMIPNRAWKIGAQLRMATEYTGKRYKRTDAARASEDVKAWAEGARGTLSPG